MMLSYQSILSAVNSGEVIITPFDERNVGPASYDLTLGTSFVSVPKSSQYTHTVRTMESKYIEKKTIVQQDGEFIIAPKGFVLATTKEWIKVPVKYAMYVEGRSSVGRMGLQVQNAGFIDPGFEGQITLELFNASDVPIALKPGRRICQITLISLDEPTNKPYSGKYIGQMGAVSSRIEEDREVSK